MFRFLKKPENFTDIKVSKFFLLLSCICLIKVTFKLYCSNRIWDVLRVLLGRNFVSDLPTLKPKKPKNLKKLQFFSKNLGFYKPWSQRLVLQVHFQRQKFTEVTLHYAVHALYSLYLFSN